MANSIGNIGEFQEGKETFECYSERLEQYFIANNIGEDRAVSVFLTVIGPNAYALLKSLVSPRKPKDMELKDLQDILQRHFTPQPLTIAERFKFHKRDQKDQESISSYVVELKRLAAPCDFGNFLTEALRDRLVCGLRDSVIQRRLLAEAKLSFDDAVKTAVAMEMASNETKELHSSTVAKTTMDVNVLKGSKGSHKFTPSNRTQGDRSAKPCYRCLSIHDPNDCQFKTASCHYCKKTGHIAKACRKKQKDLERKQKKSTNNARFVDTDGAQNDPFSCEEQVNVFDIFTTTEKKTPSYKIQVCVGDQPIDFEIDTGASLTVIPQSVYESKLSRWPIEETDVTLRTYTNELVKVSGRVSVPVKCNSQVHRLPLYIVSGAKPSLLGRNWLSVLRLNWSEIFSVGQIPGRSYEAIMAAHPEVFDENIATSVRDFTARIDVKEGAKPMYFKARSVPYALKAKVEQELKRLETLGIITKVDKSNWASPIVVVTKSDGSVRLCGDYKVWLNRMIEEHPYPLPTAEDLFAKLSGGTVFSKLDLTNAYLQLQVEEESKKYLTINTHLGLYQFNRLPYGITSAPSIFQCTMEQILQGIPHVCCYLDDILISAPTQAEHDQTFDLILRKFSKLGIKIKKSKCEFSKSSVQYLGHQVDQKGLRPIAHKEEAIENAPAPKDLTELRSYLGLLNYYGKFIPNLSSRIHPLNNLLRKGVKWAWTVECQKAFDASKKMLVENSVLAHYDVSKPLRLACDASAYGIGAVISHVSPDGQEHPIAFASRTLSNSEKNYAQIEREALSLIYGVKKFHKYLYGRKFELVTDHKPLTAILNPKSPIPTLAAARMQRWALLLSAYNYSIVYRRSEDNANADALSRLPLSPVDDDDHMFYFSYVDELPVTASDICQATQKDPLLAQVYEFIMHGWPGYVKNDAIAPYFSRRNELSADKGCVLWGMRVVIPDKYRGQMLEELHNQHLGMSQMKSFARSFVWWPGLDAQIEQRVAGCQTCMAMSNKPPAAPLQPWPWPTQVWERLHIDFAEWNQQHFLILIDSFSKWVEVFHMTTTTTTRTVDVLRSLFAAYGLPKEIVSDNGPQFSASEFKAFTDNNGIKHTRVPPYHPSSNGAAERTVQIVKRALQKQMLDSDLCKRNLTLHHKLANFLITYRNTPHSTTGQTPAELFLKRAPRTRFSLLKPSLSDRVLQKQQNQKKYHDQSRVRERSFKVNQWVRVRNMRGSILKWLPGRITKVCGPRTFLVKLSDSGQTRYVHMDHILAHGEGTEVKEGLDPQNTPDSESSRFVPKLLPRPITDVTAPSIPNESLSRETSMDPVAGQGTRVEPSAGNVSQPAPPQPSVPPPQLRRNPPRLRKPLVKLNL